MSDAGSSKYAPVPGKIPGPVVNLSGQELVLAPMNLDGVQEFLALQAAFDPSAGDMRSLINHVARALHISLRRNYPDMTVADVEGLLDVGNIGPAMDLLSAASGLQKAPSGESRPAST